MRRIDDVGVVEDLDLLDFLWQEARCFEHDLWCNSDSTFLEHEFAQS